MVVEYEQQFAARMPPASERRQADSALANSQLRARAVSLSQRELQSLSSLPARATDGALCCALCLCCCLPPLLGPDRLPDEYARRAPA